MKSNRTFMRGWPGLLAALVFLALCILVRVPALASDNSENDMVVFGGQYQVIKEGQEVRGDLVVIGGSVDVYGKVDGDAVAIGGTIHIEPQGRVDGSIVNVGGAIHDESNSSPGHGAMVPPAQIPTPQAMEQPQAPESGFDWGWTWFYLVDALLTIVAFLLFPVLTRNARASLIDNPVISGVLGFFSPIIFVLVIIALAITIIGIPLIPLAVIVTIVGYLVGKAAIAEFLGERIFSTTKRNATPLLSVLVGAALMFLLCALTDWIGVVLYFCLAALAIGATLPLVRTIAPRRVQPTITPPGPPTFSPPVDPAHMSPPAPQ